ncbi:hypothetical protein PanWU01x14_143070, partial [Parasponia andersonii]
MDEIIIIAFTDECRESQSCQTQKLCRAEAGSSVAASVRPSSSCNSITGWPLNATLARCPILSWFLPLDRLARLKAASCFVPKPLQAQISQ